MVSCIEPAKPFRRSVAVGLEGNVYVVNTENQAIRMIDTKSGVITTIAGSGPNGRGFGGDVGPATAARMDRPHGICVGADGAVYFGDTNNHRVRRVWRSVE
jgi:streptogramin lyase